MAPRQVIPYDEDGRRTSRQLLVETHQQQQQRHLQQQQQQQQWADPAATAVENELPSCFAPPAISRREGFAHHEHQQQYSSDLRDALGDEDDEDEDGDESVELGAPINWAIRDLVPKPPGVEIFVGGLTRSTRRDMLRDWFQHAGEVTEVRIARDKRRRRCRGYCYVRFATSEEANRAIDTMHRFEFKHGRFLGVLPSDENRTLFVGGLREEWSCAYICQLLKEEMPGLRKVEPIPDREDPFKIRTFCFLEFASHAEAAAIFDRHQTSPRPAAPTRASSSSSAPPQKALPPLPDSGAAASLEQRAQPDGGVELFFERDNRDGSTTSTGDTSGGEFFASRAPAASSPDHDGGDGGGDPDGGLLRFEVGGLGSVWGRQRHLGAEVNGRGGDGGGGIGVSDQGFPSWSDAPAAATAPTSIEFGNDPGAGVVGDGERGGNGETTTSGGGVPLVVGGATLKVDWADPLRYHIHLNGGIKGPSAPPEFGMPDGHPSSRGGNGGGGRNVSANGGCRRAGPGNGGGGVPRCGGGFGVGRSWQQQQQQEQHQVGLTRHPSGPVGSLSTRWQDVDHPVHAVQHQHQLHRLQQQRHQRQCVETPYSRGASPVTTRDRGYTIATDVNTGPRRAPYCDDSGDRQRAVSSSSSSGGAPPPPRHHPRHHRHHDHHASRNHHRHTLLELSSARLEVPADREDSGDDGRRLTIPSSWESSSEGRLPPPPHHGEGAGAGPASSFRTHQQHPLGGARGGGAGGAGGGFERRHSYHQHHHEVAGPVPASGRPYSASPDDGRRDRLGALSVGSGGGGGYNGDGRAGRAGSDVSFGTLRSSSRHPLTSERHLQHAAGLLPSSLPSWDRHSSLGEEAAVGTRISSGSGAAGWSSGGRGAATARTTAGMETGERSRSMSWVSGAAPAFDGHVSMQRQQQQQQRWEHQEGIVHDRAAEGLATKDRGWTFGTNASGGSGSSATSGRDNNAADFATAHRDLIAQQQQHRSERFSSAFAGSAALHPDDRRRSSFSDGLLVLDSAGLDGGGGARGDGLLFGDGAGRSHNIGSDNGTPPPPGFSATAAARSYGGGGGVDSGGDGWANTSMMSVRSNAQQQHERRQQQQQYQQGERRGRSVDVVDPVADLHIDAAGLWESVAAAGVAAGGNGRSDRQSSWPSALLPPDSGDARHPEPWGS